MNTAFLYPSSLLDLKNVDETYCDEYQMAKQAGLAVHIFDINEISTSSIYPKLPEDATIVYRGWMLNKDSYQQLEQRFGRQLLTSTNKYLQAHHFPNWHPALKTLTMHSIITDEEHMAQVFQTNFKRAFCKDFVKSLKTGNGGIIESFDEIPQMLENMKKYRDCIEGGIVLRQVADLIPNSEIRFFVVGNTIFSSKQEKAKYSIAQQAVQLLAQDNLTFYSVDVATTTDGREIIIEIGDGQVSDYVGWPLDKFISVLQQLSNYSQQL